MTINMRRDLSRSAAAGKAAAPLFAGCLETETIGAKSGNTAAPIRHYQGDQRYQGENAMKVLVPALILLAAPAIAFAQPPAGGGGGGGAPRAPQTPEQIEASFKQMDTNKDGAISKEEWTAAGRREQGFARFDTNSDGKITLEEMKAAPAGRPGGGAGGGAPPAAQ
jgi:hypothetical protein